MDVESAHESEAAAEIDAPWSDPDPTEASASAGDDEPKADDFKAPWGDPFVAPTESPSADALWDEPRVAESAPAEAPAEAINGSDLDFVWSPPTPSAQELLAELHHGESESTPAAPRRKSFISRLFSRNKADEPSAAEQQAAQLAALLSENAATEAPSETEPAMDDFAEAPTIDAFAETLPIVDDETPVDVFADTLPIVDEPAPEPELRPRPSLDHSADDAAQLAELLAVSHVPPARVETPVEEPSVELSFIETESSIVEPEADVVDEPVMEDVVDPALIEAPVEGEAPAPPSQKNPGFFGRLMWRRSQVRPPIVEPPAELERGIDADVEEVAVDASLVESESAVEAPVQEDVADSPLVASAPVEEAPAPPTPKPGFFGRLMWRRSQARPPVVEQPREDEGVADTAETEDETFIEVEVDVPDVAADADASPAIDDAAADESEFEDMAPVEPFPPFIDARDEINAELVAERATVETGRITEAVPQPVEDPFAEGEKTDEFEVVPNPSDELAAGAETQQISRTFLGKLFGKKTNEDTQPVPVVEPPTGTIAEPGKIADDKAPFVIAKFRMFYNEIIRDKHQKSDVISGFATAIVSAAAADLADPEFAAQLLSKRLSEMLELQAAESNWTGGDAAKHYPDAQYAMVALADETFSTIEWPGRPSWHKYMLEPKMYSSRGADLEFFKRVDKLLREPNPSKGARDLARVYLLVIASGFRGKFRVPNLHRPLAEYRRRLYEFSHLADPLELYGRERKLLPEAMEHTLAGRAVGRFTPAQKWIAAVVILLVAYAAVSHFAWTKLSAELKDVMSRIEAPAGPGGAP